MQITNDQLSPYGGEVAAACPDYSDCGSSDVNTRETDGTTDGVEKVLYCNDCGIIVPHTCPPVADCPACALLIRAGEDKWDDLGWGDLVALRTQLEASYASAAMLPESDIARYYAIVNELKQRITERG